MANAKDASQSRTRPRQAATGTPARNVKRIMQKLVEKLDPASTWDDVMYEVYVCQKIAAGLRDAENGRLLTEDEVYRELET